jgi:hypothetical protein
MSSEKQRLTQSAKLNIKAAKKMLRELPKMNLTDLKGGTPNWENHDMLEEYIKFTYALVERLDGMTNQEFQERVQSDDEQDRFEIKLWGIPKLV